MRVNLEEARRLVTLREAGDPEVGWPDDPGPQPRYKGMPSTQRKRPVAPISSVQDLVQHLKKAKERGVWAAANLQHAHMILSNLPPRHQAAVRGLKLRIESTLKKWGLKP